MPMRSTLVLLAVLILAACSPAVNTAPDAGADIAQLVGTWTGTSTITSGAQSGSVTSAVHIAQSSLGLVTLDICPDLSPVSATVQSPLNFSLVTPHTCPAGAVTGCSSAALTYTSGSGSIGPLAVPIGSVPDGGSSDAGANPVLTFTASGTLAGCQSSSPLTVRFTGTKS